MDLGLSGRVAIVAGASKGLGKAIALGLAREGANVAICARSRESLTDTAKYIEEKYGVTALPIPADLRNTQDVERVVENTIKQFNRVDILLNNAGGPPPKSFEESTSQDWEGAIALNFLAGMRLIQLVLPYMKARRWGRIVNILSSGLKQPIDGLIQSNAARAAVAGAAKTLSREVGAYGILVNNVCPGRRGRCGDRAQKGRERRRSPARQLPRDSHWALRPAGGVCQCRGLFGVRVCQLYHWDHTPIDGGYIRSLW